MRSWATNRRSGAAAALVALLLAGAPVAGCTAAQKEANAYRLQEAKRNRAKKAISDRASEYCLALRWKDWKKAAAYLEQEADRVDYLDVHDGDRELEGRSIDQIAVRYVVVDDSMEKAEVRVAWVEVGPPDFRTVPREDTQLWYKRYGEWWLLPTTVLRPGAEPARRMDAAASSPVPSGDGDDGAAPR
ncbi:hypothetical protein L6R50_08100 [Myxococcota bacterium]|nr:hypothetical protein [Myxococcota bacterium]